MAGGLGVPGMGMRPPVVGMPQGAGSSIGGKLRSMPTSFPSKGKGFGAKKKSGESEEGSNGSECDLDGMVEELTSLLGMNPGMDQLLEQVLPLLTQLDHMYDLMNPTEQEEPEQGEE